ncbi:PREDICTED: thaumatin-like protein 1b [Tarenaya hassleriana]|uniref:thaumatin-like protein 1b n=1 Tax=Tarenaya hassleriana TaxID=28532 RepID=UPI00053C4A28|nr:PREDICTED: thaumatin-like protein 1b [Tarenaya hassleriana]
MSASTLPLISLAIVFHFLVVGVDSATFTMINKCDYTVWPGILSNAGVPPLPTTGFSLQPGESRSLDAPPSWGGRFWGRTHCSEDSAGKFVCTTGDCGSGKLECSGAGAAPPATLAEFTLDGAGGMDFFDVSLVDGYNLPMLVVPQGGSGDNCTSTGCVVDLNGACPSQLRVTTAIDGGESAVACRSACEAFKEEQFCCSGAYGTPDTCKPSVYSQIFKSACPRAYSYAYDDKSSTFTCSNSPGYSITFCPSPNTSQKSSQERHSTETTTSGTNSSPQDTTMVYEGAFDRSGSTPTTCAHVLMSVSAWIALAAWRLRG